MLSRRITAVRPLTRLLLPAARPLLHARTAMTEAERLEIEDPGMNGGYINPPAIKRQHRDPYGDWWDKQERRNYGEPVHEDNDILGMLSTYDYTHFSAGWGAVLLGTFVAAVFGLAGAVSLVYPDKVSVPKEYEDGLEAELGGPRAVRARKQGEEAFTTPLP